MSFESTRPSGRKVLDLAAFLRLPSQEFIHVRTLDIGRDGMCVASKVAVASNTVCTVQLPAAGSSTEDAWPLQLRVRVVYSVANTVHGVQMGLHFQALSEEEQSLLDQLLARSCQLGRTF